MDVAVHIKVEEHRKALDNLGKKIKTATAQYEEWQDNGEEIPLEIEENMAAIPTLKKNSVVHSRYYMLKQSLHWVLLMKKP